jgi:hypothetical protein
LCFCFFYPTFIIYNETKRNASYFLLFLKNIVRNGIYSILYIGLNYKKGGIMYDYNEMEKKAVKILTNNNLIVSMRELISYLPLKYGTFYDKKLNESDKIKKALEQNKVNIKTQLKRRWLTNDNATTQIALYRLAADNDELDRLNNNKFQISNDDNKGLNVTIKRESINKEAKDG